MIYLYAKGNKTMVCILLPKLFCEKKIVLATEKKFEIRGQEFAKHLGSLEQFVQIVKGQNNF
jgi:hypothetical protein